MAMLYGAATADSLEPIVPAVSFLTGSNAGYFGGGVRAVNGVGPGAPAWVQVRAWDSRLGNSYEQVIALGIGGYGESILLHINSGGTLQGLPAPLLGQRWRPSFGQENAEIKLGSQVPLD